MPVPALLIEARRHGTEIETLVYPADAEWIVTARVPHTVKALMARHFPVNIIILPRKRLIMELMRITPMMNVKPAASPRQLVATHGNGSQA